jgi:Domain of unknown function (DUF4406)
VEISSTEFGRRLMSSVGAQMGVTYLSAPISTGLRDVRLMRELGVSKQELRERFPSEYRKRVLEPNEREARKYAQMVRRLGGGDLVVCPGELYVPDWSQPDYWKFWEEVIRSFCLNMAVAPGWELSTGARLEVGIALQTMLRISDIRGNELGPRELQIIDARGRAGLLDEGFTPGEVSSYVPWIDFTRLSSDPGDFVDNIQAFTDIAVRHNDEVRRRSDEDARSEG